jgi:membrane protease subunit (stomatin/prohibitin family)
MPLLRGVARTAVIAGTATAVSNRVSRRQAGRWAEKDQQASDAQAYQDQQQYPPQQQAAPPPAAPPGDDMSAKLSQLKQLGELKDQGVITDAEFDAQKAKILG